MTHSDAIARDDRGFPGRDCPGELGRTMTYIIHGQGPGRYEWRVDIYTCPACAHVLSIHESGRVLDCHPIPSPRSGKACGSPPLGVN